MPSTRFYPWLSLALRVVCAAIIGQTLFFKFTGAPAPVEMFTKLGVEPWGRLGAGVLELVAITLLFCPQSAARRVGVALTLATMSVAIGLHLTILGVVTDSDGGLLFGLAWTVAIAAAGCGWLEGRTGSARFVRK
jgi:hypothetical protein